MQPTRKDEPESSELWTALTTIPRPHRVVPFPRTKPGTDEPVGEVAIWPLTQEEQMIANAEADRFTKKLLQDPQQKDQANLGYHHTYSNEVAIQILFHACRDAKNLERPAFPSPSLMRQRFSTDEVGVLFNHYLTTQAEVGPIVVSMSKEEVDALILRLQREGSAFPFDSLSWEQQLRLVSTMASRIVSCWMAMCSAGLPLEASPYVTSRIAEMVESSPEMAPATDSPAEEEPPPPLTHGEEE